MCKEKFFKIIQKKVGLSLSEINRLNPADINAHIEKQSGKKIEITTEFPFIGRGNVLRNGIVTHDEINREIDKILDILD